MNAPYPNATIYPHTAMSATQTEKVCAETGLECRMDSKGVLTLELPREWHDDKPDDKAEKGSWSDWKNNQQPEHTPGMGRR